MNAVNSVVQLFILVWTFTAVCQADVDVCSVICEDVTGIVGEEITFTCSVSRKCTKRCIIMYKFKYKDLELCREDLPKDSCEQRNSFTCRYTPTTAMTGQSIFFVQRTGGTLNTEFTVNITEPIKPEVIPKAPEPMKSLIDPDDPGEKGETDKSEPSKPERAEGRGFKVAVIAAVVSGFIIIIMPIIYKMKQNYKQKRTFLDNRQEVV